MNNQFPISQYRPNQQRLIIPQYPIYAQIPQQIQPGHTIVYQNIPQNVNISYSRNNSDQLIERQPIKQATFHVNQTPENPIQNKVVLHSFSKDQSILPFPSSQTGLIQPPILSQNPRQSQATHTQSSQHAQYTRNQQVNSSQNQNQLRQIVWGQRQQDQQDINKTFWQQKFLKIYGKFEWLVQKFQKMKQDYGYLSQLLNKVDSQQEWNQLKHNHMVFAENLQDMFDQLIAVAGENQHLFNQRLGQQNQVVWERRYHQLLSNFKALKQQNIEMQKQFENYRMQENQGENYQNLLNHCNLVQQEYDKILNQYNILKQEYQKLKGLSHSQKASDQNGPTYQQFQHMRLQYERNIQEMQNQYKNDYGQLQATCQQLYEQKQHLKQQLTLQSQNHSQSQSSSAQIQHLYQVIQQKQSHIQHLAHENSDMRQRFQYLQQQLTNHQNDNQRNEKIMKQNQIKLKQKNRQVQILKNQLADKSKQLQNNQKKIVLSLQQQYSSQITRLRLQNQKLTLLNNNFSQQVYSLRVQLQSYIRDSSSKDLIKYQLESLQKKILFVQQQNQILTESIKNKNQQLIALRNLSLELSNYDNLMEKYRTIEKEKSKLEESYKKQMSDVNGLKRKLNQVENQNQCLREENRGLKDKHQKNYKLKALQNQLIAQTQFILNKQAQFNKIRQLIQSKQNYINQIQNENLKTLAKVDHLNLIIQNQRNQFNLSLDTLKKKLQTEEKRNKTFSNDFKKQMQQNYERQIKQLRKSNEQKHKKIKKLEDQLLQNKNKSGFIEKFSVKERAQLENLKKKCQNIQLTKNELLTNLNVLQKDIKTRDVQIQNLRNKDIAIKKQINTCNVQLQEADSLIKSKNNVILDYERQIHEYLQKIKELEQILNLQKNNNQQKVKFYQQQVQNLKNRLYTTNPEQRIENSRLSVNSYNISSPNRMKIQKLQTNIIEQLTQQNNNLKIEIIQLNKKLTSLQTVSRVVATMDHSRKKSNINMNEKQSQHIQERLLKFNERLQNCIQANQMISIGGIDLTASQRIAHFEREKRQLQIKYQRQIKILRDKLEQYENQANTAAAQENLHKNIDGDIKDMNKFQMMNQEKERSTLEQLQFLKLKFNQQTRTNSALIKLNDQLKSQIQKFALTKQSSTSQYYKLQYQECQLRLQQTQNKLKKLSQQNKKLQSSSTQKDNHLIKNYELKAFQMQSKIKQLQRQNRYLQMYKAKNQNQRANLIHDVNVYSADIQAIKSNMDSKVEQYEKVNLELKNKCEALESQVQRLSKSHQVLNTRNYLKVLS